MDSDASPEPRRPRRLEPVFLTLAIATYAIAVVVLALPIVRTLRGLPIRPEEFAGAALFIVAGTGCLAISVGRSRR